MKSFADTKIAVIGSTMMDLTVYADILPAAGETRFGESFTTGFGVYFLVTIAVGFTATVGFGFGVYGRGFQVLVGIGLGVVLLPFRLAVIINFPVFGSV